MAVIVVAHTHDAEGAAALEHGVAEARMRGARLVVVSGSRRRGRDAAPVADQLDDSGVELTVRDLTGDYDFAEAVLAEAQQSAAELIVIGIRHRTPVGKLVMASPAQRILLDARCPVTAVKAKS